MANVAPMAINVSVYRKLPYDSAQDFAPITLLASFPNVLVVHPSVPARNVGYLVALARAAGTAYVRIGRRGKHHKKRNQKMGKHGKTRRDC